MEREPEKINVNEIFENAMKDPTLFSTIDIANLLNSLENEKNDYLENKSMRDITNEIYDTVSEDLKIPKKQSQEICNKLIGYRYVDKVNELHLGTHVRWIRQQENGKDCKLTNGGIVVNIKFLDNGIHVLVRNNGCRFIQYKFDECVSFQKLSMEEQLILMAYDHIEK
jgi:hypothetical protein